MIELHVDRDYGHDETFEIETVEEAEKMQRELQADPDVRRIWAWDDNGNEIFFWSQS